MIAVAPSELEDQVLDADASGNKLRVDALLLGAIKNLKLNKAKPDAILYMNLIYLAKSKPELFLSSRIVEVSLLQAKKTFKLFKPWLYGIDHEKNLFNNQDLSFFWCWLFPCFSQCLCYSADWAVLLREIKCWSLWVIKE